MTNPCGVLECPAAATATAQHGPHGPWPVCDAHRDCEGSGRGPVVYEDELPQDLCSWCGTWRILTVDGGYIIAHEAKS